MKEKEMINELLGLAKIKDELWRYHPDNPKRVDVEHEYEKLDNYFNILEKELEKLDRKLEHE